MSWIKRNLALVISGVIAIGLLGLGGWYLYSAMDKNSSIDNEINQTKSEIERLLNMDPSPVKSNLDNAQVELKRLTAFIGEAKKLFPPTPPPAEPLNNESFKSLLATTVNDLNRQAASVGIRVPTNEALGGAYYYTFESQRLPVTFPPESLRPLSERLHEVQMLMSVLIKSRINRLVGIRRAYVPGEGTPQGPQGTADYLNIPPRTNAETSMVLWPYEVTFEAFSPELGKVMEELEHASYAVIVKYPVIETAEEMRSSRLRDQQLGGGNPPPDRRFPGRPNAPAAPAAAAAAPAALTPVINERLMRVTLRIDVIKPEPVQPGSGGPGPGGGRGGPRGGRGGGPGPGGQQ